MTDQQFSGAIVLKARSEVEAAALAAQLAWYAEFGPPFYNRYESGYAVKGQVRAAPSGGPDQALLEAQNRELAAQLAAARLELGEQAWRLQQAERRAAGVDALLALLTPIEHLRLIDRNIAREHPHLWADESAIEADDHPAALALADLLLERAAATIERLGPDDPLINLRAAERAAAIIRSLKPHEEHKP